MTIQKLTQARNMLKKIYCDNEKPESFYPVTVIDHNGYTVLVAPQMGIPEASPIVHVISNDVLLEIASHAENINNGDDSYDDISFSFEFDCGDDMTDGFASFWFDYTVTLNGTITIDAKFQTNS